MIENTVSHVSVEEIRWTCLCAADYWDLKLATFETFIIKLVSVIENGDRIVFVLVKSYVFIYYDCKGR